MNCLNLTPIGLELPSADMIDDRVPSSRITDPTHGAIHDPGSQILHTDIDWIEAEMGSELRELHVMAVS